MLTSAERHVQAALRQWTVALVAVPAFALFSTLLLSITQVDGVPGLFVVVLVALAALSAWKPGPALMVLAAAVPVAMWTGRWWNGRVAWAEVLVVAFAAGYSARAAWTRRTRLDSLSLPIVVFTSIVLASLAVRVLVLHWTIGGEALWAQLTGLAAGDYFIGAGGFRELDAAMRLIEGMLLLRAASSTAQNHPAFAPALIRWFVIGATGAAALNLWRLWGGAIRSDTPIATFFGYLTTLRYNVHYADVNAAGSYFVMALLVAVGLTVATRRVYWFVATAVIATSLMLSGSRAALLAGAVAAVVWVVWRTKGLLTRRNLRWSAFATAGIVLVVALVAALAYVAMSRNLTPSSTALQIRAEFAKTTFRMVEDYPAFGVGIGQYAYRSSEYSSQTLLETFHMPRENAHNNFLQILGELGLIGLAGFVWVVWAAGRRCVDGLRRLSDRVFQGAVFGALAFVLTWFAGHPLLMDEPALQFWLLLGTAAAAGHATSATAAPVRRQATLVVIPILLACSLPLRANGLVADANLEHRGIGLSGWHEGLDGVQYRLAGPRCTLFVPADASVISVPLRGARGGVDVKVALLLDGRLADIVQVSGDAWRQIQIALHTNSDSPRFRRLELRAQGEWPEDEAVLSVGKVQPR